MTTREDKLAEEVRRIQALRKEDSSIDTQALVTDAIMRHRTDTASSKPRMRSYLLSLFFPPVGLFIALKLFLQDEDDAREAAWICLVLTAVSGFATVWLLTSVFSTPTVQKIESITPQQIQEIYQ